MPRLRKADRRTQPRSTKRNAVHVAGRLVVGVDLLGPWSVTGVDIEQGPRVDVAVDPPSRSLASVPELQMRAITRLAGFAATEAVWGSEAGLAAVIGDLLYIVDMVDESIARTGDGLSRTADQGAVRAWLASAAADSLAGARRTRVEDVGRVAWGMVTAQLDVVHEIAETLVRDGTIDPGTVWSRLIDGTRRRRKE